MSKIRIRYYLKSSDNTIDKEVIGIKKKNSIIFKDEDVLTNIEITPDNIIMKRENDSFLLNLSLGKISKGIYLLKEYNKEINMDICLQEKMITDNTIYFKYSSELDNIEFKLEYEVI